MADTNPFLRYRDRLDSYRAVTEGRLSDQRFVEIVSELDEAVAAVDGHGFVETPLIDGTDLARAAGLGPTELWIKVEAGNVGDSHKARHLMGVAIGLLVDEELSAGPVTTDRLAIASCGNAALGAGVIAAALKRRLQVFVPTWADETVVARLETLGADVSRCPRIEGESGDPAYLRFSEAVAAGARSFSVQGTDTPSTFDGARTLGWEIADQLPGGPGDDDRLYVQVGGGALAVAVSSALPRATLYPVQAEGCAPLRRAWDRLAPGFDFEAAAADPGRYMWAWEDEPHSIATGILDDVTYDWLPLLHQTLASGGEPLVVPEPVVAEAHQLAHTHTDVAVCTTGTAGLAGLLHHRRIGQADPAARSIVLFTGLDRT
jgi:threonine synthase